MKSSIIPVRRSPEEQTKFEVTFKEIFEHGFGFNEVIGLKVESFATESPRLKFDMRPELVGSYIHKRLHGGVIATALDTVGGFAVAVAVAEKYASETAEQVVARFSRFGTIDLRIDYLRLVPCNIYNFG